MLKQLKLAKGPRLAAWMGVLGLGLWMGGLSSAQASTMYMIVTDDTPLDSGDAGIIMGTYPGYVPGSATSGCSYSYTGNYYSQMLKIGGASGKPGRMPIGAFTTVSVPEGTTIRNPSLLGSCSITLGGVTYGIKQYNMTY